MPEALERRMDFKAAICRVAEELASLFRRDRFRRREVGMALPLEDVLDIEFEHVALGLGDCIGQPLECRLLRHLATADVVLHSSPHEQRPVAEVYARQDGAISGDLGDRLQGIKQPLGSGGRRGNSRRVDMHHIPLRSQVLHFGRRNARDIRPRRPVGKEPQGD